MILTQCHKIAVRCLNKKTPLIVKISSSLSTAIIDCRIYSLLFIWRELSCLTLWNFTAAPARKPCVWHAQSYSCRLTRIHRQNVC